MKNMDNCGLSNRCADCPARPKCSFFSAPAVQAVMERGHYSRGCVIVQQGEAAGEVLIVRSGWLRLLHLSSSGKAVTDMVGPGTIIGVPEVVTGTPHRNSVETIEGSDLEWVEAAAFLTLLKSNPVLAIELLKTVSQQALKWANRLNDHAGRMPSDERLLQALREISENFGSQTPYGVKIQLPLSIQDLADKIGCSRQWVWKMLGDLEAEGQLRRKGSWITLLTSDESGTNLVRTA